LDLPSFFFFLIKKKLCLLPNSNWDKMLLSTLGVVFCSFVPTYLPTSFLVPTYLPTSLHLEIF
jgi:hypothetical protein